MPTLAELLDSSWSEEEKTASAAQDENQHPEVNETSVEKIAMDLGIYEELFPEDKELTNTKVAQEDKLASYQEELGERANFYCGVRFGQRLTKIANEVLVAAQGNMPGARPPQAHPTDQSPADAQPRDPAAATGYSVAVGQEAGAEGQVGSETPPREGDGDVHDQEAKLAAAMRKQFLKRQQG